MDPFSLLVLLGLGTAAGVGLAVDHEKRKKRHEAEWTAHDVSFRLINEVLELEIRVAHHLLVAERVLPFLLSRPLAQKTREQLDELRARQEALHQALLPIQARFLAQEQLTEDERQQLARIAWELEDIIGTREVHG